MGNNSSPPQNGENTTMPDLTNITDSDQDILLLQHLIEIDTVQMRSENKLFVRETLTYRNAGTKDFLGYVRSWIPDGAEGISVARVEMRENAMPTPLVADQKGNIISWQDLMRKNDPIPPLYIIQYFLPAEPQGTFTSSKYYSKKFLYPTLVTKKPFSVILKVTSSEDESITITDEKGNSISTSGSPTKEGDNSVLYGWDMPGFTEFNIKMSMSAWTLSKVTSYAIPGILILLVLSYPFIRKRSENIQDIEEKIRATLKREPEEEIEEEIPEVEEKVPERTSIETIPGTPVETKKETVVKEEVSPDEIEGLESEKNEMLSRLRELEMDYSSGNLLDEEYEELREPLYEKIEKINERIKQLKKDE